MTLGEVKAEALKLMFARADVVISANLIDLLAEDERFSDYLRGMTGAVNRCFSSLEQKRILPLKTYLVPAREGTDSDLFLRVDLTRDIPDLFDVCRVCAEYEDTHRYIGAAPFEREGYTLLLENRKDAHYRVLYYPVLPRISASSPNELSLPLPEGISSLIPYYIKGDLFRLDDPAEAAEARNWYEQMTDNYCGRDIAYPTSQSVFSLAEV